MSVRSLTRSGLINFAETRSMLVGNDKYVEPAYELIESIFVTTVGEYVFTSIPQNYKHLQIRFTSKSSTSSVSDTLLRLNGDDGNNYVWHELQGQGSSVFSTANTNQTIMRIATQPATTQTNIFAGGVVDILDYTDTSKNTVIRTFAGNHSNEMRVHLYSGLWRNTAAVNSISIIGSAGIGSRFSLYGIKG
jgi:hypothetical protein